VKPKKRKYKPRWNTKTVKCTECGGECKAGSSRPAVVYYYCKECGSSQKIPRGTK